MYGDDSAECLYVSEARSLGYSLNKNTPALIKRNNGLPIGLGLNIK